MRKSVQILQVGFTYIGTVVGAGFASGQEILQFFTRYGRSALLTIAIATAIFIWLGIKMMLIAHDRQAASYEELNRILFGRRGGQWLSLFLLVALFGTATVMLAGAGSLFEEQLHLPFQAGLAVTLVLSYFVITGGIRAILAVNSVVVPIMLAFTAAVVLSTWHQPGASNWVHLTSDDSAAAVLFAPVLYTAFNLAMAQAVLVPLGSAIQDRKVLVYGGLAGGLGIGLMLLAAHYALSAQMPGIVQFEIPMGRIVHRLGEVIRFLYAIVIYGEIFTTYIADVYGLALQLESRTRLNRKIIIVGLLAATYLISQIGFTVLLTTLYPLFGLVSLVWLAFLVWRRQAPVS